MTRKVEELESLSMDGVVPTIPLSDVAGQKSPCLECPRKNKDKMICSTLCKRLFAYRLGRDYTELPIPDLADADGESESKEDRADDSPSQKRRGRPPKPKPPKDKVVCEQKPEGKTCQVRGCNKPHLARGFCSTHWSAWRIGNLPGFGEYAPALTRNSVTKIDENKESVGVMEPDTTSRATILVMDFRHAQDLWREIERTAKNLRLPMEHIALTLIAQGLRGVEKERCKEEA